MSHQRFLKEELGLVQWAELMETGWEGGDRESSLTGVRSRSSQASRQGSEVTDWTPQGTEVIQV